MSGGGGGGSGAPSQRERDLQSRADKASSRVKELERELSRKRTSDRVVYGGLHGSRGGGNPRSDTFCRSYNSQNGCDRDACNYKHACNVEVNGRACARDHPACKHNAPRA